MDPNRNSMPEMKKANNKVAVDQNSFASSKVRTLSAVIAKLGTDGMLIRIKVKVAATIAALLG